jgi:proteic killer suppression protein
MIRSFADKRTIAVLGGRFGKSIDARVARVARRKLQRLDAAEDLADLREPPGNRLERLRGDREGQWSIRVNDQWRICFVWREDGAHAVELVDYH